MLNHNEIPYTSFSDPVTTCPATLISLPALRRINTPTRNTCIWAEIFLVMADFSIIDMDKYFWQAVCDWRILLPIWIYTYSCFPCTSPQQYDGNHGALIWLLIISTHMAAYILSTCVCLAVYTYSGNWMGRLIELLIPICRPTPKYCHG